MFPINNLITCEIMPDKIWVVFSEFLHKKEEEFPTFYNCLIQRDIYYVTHAQYRKEWCGIFLMTAYKNKK